jgi:tryptophan 2,3-dioxygenase
MTEEDTGSHAAAALRQVLQGPIYNRTLHKEVGVGQLDYEVYLRTRPLLELQTPIDQLVVPDEMLFQILHQTQELWLKCVSFEASNLVQALDADEPFAAAATLDRMVVVTRCLARDIEVLFTLPPDVFQVIRRHLGNGSGLESPGYNQVLVAADAVSEAFDRKLERAGVTLRDVYTDRASHAELHRLAEQLCDWDGAFQGWLMAHFVLVRRTIGVDRSVRALDGFPTQALPARMTKPLFPRLWDVRVEMTKGWTREGGFAPGELRARRGESGVVPRHEPTGDEIACSPTGTGADADAAVKRDSK